MKKFKVYLGMLISGLGGLILSSCGVLPSEGVEPALDPLPDLEQDRLVNKIFDTKYLKADIDVNVAYHYEKEMDEEPQEFTDNYHVTGNALLDIETLDNVGANVSLTLDMNDTPEGDLPKFDVDFTYTNNTFFLDINGRSVKLLTDNIGELVELILGDGDNSGSSSEEEEESEKSSIDSMGIKDIIANIANMTVTNEGDHYKYVSHTTGDQPDLVITSDFDYNITSLSIFGVTYQDFTIDVDIKTEVLSSLTNPIVSPESASHPYINVTNYFGVLKKLRAILDDSSFGMDYQLALTHYEPKTPSEKVYLGDTVGKLSMDLDKTEVDLAGTINISDIVTDDHYAYSTTYHGQYIDKSIYLDYAHSKASTHNKLTLSNQGLNDLWDMMGDSEIFGINIFDLIFGASDKEYPIIDIVTDSTWREITKYGSINLSNNYMEVDVDNYLLGGLGHGSIKINLNNDEGRTIKNVTVTNLDINSYIVNGRLEFDDYEQIEPVEPSEYSSLDGIDALVRSGAGYYRGNKFNLGLELDIVDSDNNKSFSIINEGPTQSNAQLNIRKIHPDQEDSPVTYDGYADITISDFDDNMHHFKLNANPAGSETNVYADYAYKAATAEEEEAPVSLKLRASRDSVSSIFDSLLGYDEEKEEVDIYKMIEPYLVKVTNDTLYRVLKQGDYFAVLRDETIKSITMDDNTRTYNIVFAQESFGYINPDDPTDKAGFTDDISVTIKMKMVYEEEVEKEVIDFIQIDTKYDKYDIFAKVTLNDSEAPIPVLEDKSDYIPIDPLTNIYLNKEVHLDLEASVGKVINGTVEPYIDVRGNEENTPCTIDAEIIDTGNEDADLWDKLYAKIDGAVYTSGGSTWTPFTLGYDQNLAIKFGEDAKMYVTRENVRNIIDRAKNVLPESHVIPAYTEGELEEKPLDTEVEGNVNMFLQLMQILSDGDFNTYLTKIKSTELVKSDSGPNKLVIKVDNSMFTDAEVGESTAEITLTFTNEGIAGIALKDFRYSSFSLTGALTLQNRTRSDVEVDGFNQVYNIVDAVLNTATAKDVVLTGHIYLNADIAGAARLTSSDFQYWAFVSKEKDVNGNENVYGYLRFDNVPFVYVGTGEDDVLAYKISDNRDVWNDGSRSFELFFSSEVNYDGNGHTIPDANYDVSRTSTFALRAEYSWNNNQKVKEKFLTSDDFLGDMTYYILNYGLGIKAKNEPIWLIRDGVNLDFEHFYGEDDYDTYGSQYDFFDFKNYNQESSYTPDLSKLLEDYEYSDVGTTDTEMFPDGVYASNIYTRSELQRETTGDTWVVTINGGELVNNNMIKEVEVFTYSELDGDISYLSEFIISTRINVASVANVGIGLTLNYDRSALPDDNNELLIRPTGYSGNMVSYVREYIHSHPVGYRRYNQYNNASQLGA